MAYARRHRRLAVLAYGSLLIATFAQLIVPQLVNIIVDTVVGGIQVDSTARAVAPALIGAMLAIIAFALVRAVFSYGQQYNAERISQNIAFDFRNQLFAKIQRLSFSYLDRNQTGQLMIRATDDVEKVRLFIGQGLVVAVQSFLLLVATLIVMWFTNRSLTLVVLPILPIAFVVFFWFGAIAQPLFMGVQIRLSALNTVLQENVAGLQVVRAFGREPHEQERFNRTADAVLEQQLKVGRTFSFLFPLIFLIANLGQAAVLYFGGRQIIGGTLTHWRMAEVQPVSGVPLPADGSARLHHQPDVAGVRVSAAHFRDPRHAQRDCEQTRRPRAGLHPWRRGIRQRHVPLLQELASRS